MGLLHFRYIGSKDLRRLQSIWAILINGAESTIQDLTLIIKVALCQGVISHLHLSGRCEREALSWYKPLSFAFEMSSDLIHVSIMFTLQGFLSVTSLMPQPAPGLTGNKSFYLWNVNWKCCSRSPRPVWMSRLVYVKWGKLKVPQQRKKH